MGEENGKRGGGKGSWRVERLQTPRAFDASCRLAGRAVPQGGRPRSGAVTGAVGGEGRPGEGGARGRRLAEGGRSGREGLRGLGIRSGGEGRRTVSCRPPPPLLEGPLRRSRYYGSAARGLEPTTPGASSEVNLGLCPASEGQGREGAAAAAVGVQQAGRGLDGRCLLEARAPARCPGPTTKGMTAFCWPAEPCGEGCGQGGRPIRQGWRASVGPRLEGRVSAAWRREPEFWGGRAQVVRALPFVRVRSRPQDTPHREQGQILRSQTEMASGLGELHRLLGELLRETGWRRRWNASVVMLAFCARAPLVHDSRRTTDRRAGSAAAGHDWRCADWPRLRTLTCWDRASGAPVLRD